MKIIKDNACLIDVISEEAMLRSKAKLEKAKVKTIPISLTTIDNKTFEVRGHAGLIFFYKKDTWYYDNRFGSVRIEKQKKNKDVLNVVNKAYLPYKQFTVLKAFPLEMSSFCEDDSTPLESKYINQII